MLHYPPTNNYEANTTATTTTTTHEETNVDHDEDDGSIMNEDNIDNTTATATNDNVDFVHNDIIPAVEFACDSYALTSPSIGTGYVVLDPFSGSISMYENILDDVILHDETLLGQTLLNEMRRADDFIRTFADDDDERSSSSSSSGTRYDTPPIQTLFSVDDYFNMNLEEYFGQYTPFCPSSSSHHHHNVVSSFNGNNNILQNGEATVDWVGVDTHIGLSDDGGTTNNIVGKMVGAVRTVTMESSTNNRTHHHHHHHMVRNGAGGYEPVVTEILAWSDNNNNNIVGDNNLSKSTSYDTKYVCRVAGEAYFVDICATNCKVYAAFQEKTSGFCPFRMRDGDASNHAAGSRQQLMDIDDDDDDDDDDDELVGNNDGESIRMSKNIYCLPLIRQYDDDTTTPVKPETIASYFPMPDASITAQYAVSSFAVESTGRTLLIGTTCGTVEVWHTGMLTMSAPAPARIQIHSVHESFILRHRAMTMDAAAAARRKGGNRKCEEQNSVTTKSNDGTTEATLDDLAVLDRRSSTI